MFYPCFQYLIPLFQVHQHNNHRHEKTKAPQVQEVRMFVACASAPDLWAQVCRREVHQALARSVRSCLLYRSCLDSHWAVSLHGCAQALCRIRDRASTEPSRWQCSRSATVQAIATCCGSATNFWMQTCTADPLGPLSKPRLE